MHSKYLRIPQYEVRKFSVNYLDKIQALFSQAFGGRILSAEAILWQMMKNPCLKERALSLWQEGSLIAYNALTPYPAMLHEKEVIAALSGTSMADENYPGTSLQLVSEILNQNSDISMIIGFPNHNAFSLGVKYLNHHHVGDVAFWEARAKSLKVNPKICEFYEFTDAYERISRELAKFHDFIKIRERDFMNWRFFQRPQYDYKGFEYEKRGYIVVDTYIENNVKQLQVVDILADSKEVMGELLNYAINLAYEWNCDLVKLWLTSIRYADVLKKHGFEYGEHPFAMVVWTQELDVLNSYITMGESDIF